MISAALGTTEIILILAVLILPLFAIISLLKQDMSSANKLILAALIFFLPLLGPLIYLVFFKSNRKS